MIIMYFSERFSEFSGKLHDFLLVDFPIFQILKGFLLFLEKEIILYWLSISSLNTDL
ncbi:hypothetical protein RhiirC2_858836 [Rhizophagus irregularis]|uniref:Uncharacterized protein n=1 Tax=Rhizophagus irregularis TaxID=588596 RepID=A0A2N1M2I8_9GLOM|nr:hypothetical protein RhiirC2_858836 [Rhizophagus irregularis]